MELFELQLSLFSLLDVRLGNVFLTNGNFRNLTEINVIELKTLTIEMSC